MVKRILSMALTAVLVISAVLAALPLSAAADGLPVYRASEAFVWQDTTGKNLTKQPTPLPDQIWKWERYDALTNKAAKESDKYFLLDGGTNKTGVNTSKFAATADNECSYTYGLDDTGGFAFVGSSQLSTAVGKYWMATAGSGNTSGTPWSASFLTRNYAVRTFMPPRNGAVTITAADHENNSKIWAKKSANTNLYPMSLRIMLEDSDGSTERIWPADKEWEELQRGSSLEFEPIKLNIKKGQELHFELHDANGHLDYKEYRDDMAAYWDPVVTYNSYVTVESILPENRDAVPKNQVFTVTTDTEMGTLTENDVTITGAGAPVVAAVVMSDDLKTASISFDGLESGEIYNVIINSAGGGAMLCGFDFTTVSTRYRASKAYRDGNDNNPIGQWQWDYYDAATGGYEKLPYFRNATANSRGFSASSSHDACTAVGQYKLYGDTRTNGNGGFKADDTYKYSWQRYNPARTFTAPESGNVTITADDGQGGAKITTDGTAAPNLRIRLERGGEYTQVWPADKEWQSVSAAAPVNFGAFTLNIKKGDKLHFELSGQHANAGTCWQMRAYWDPIVTYDEIHPTVTGTFPESGAKDVPGNTEFTVTFEEEICEPSLNDVEIDGGAEASRVWLTGGNVVHILLDSTTLKERTAYTLKLKNVRLTTMDVPNLFEEVIEFTTALQVMFGEFSRSGAAVTLPINNTIGVSQPVSVTVIAVLCKGTPESYTIKSARYQTKEITGKSDITVTLDAAPGSGEFVKAAAVTAPAFGKLLTDMAILK